MNGQIVKTLWQGLQAASSDQRVRALMALMLVMIGGASVFYWFFERWSFLDSVYFSVITFSTVGNGDLAPQTVPGKVFTIGHIFCGIDLFVATVTSIADGIIKSNRKP